MTEQNPPKEKTSGKEFLLIVISALVLSYVFIKWMQTSPGRSGAPSEVVNKPAPPLLASVWINGDQPTPEELEGEVYVVIAWATWCAPCYHEAPHLVALHEKYAPKGVQFFGLTAAQSSERTAVSNWLKDTNITWPNGFGNDAYKTLSALKADYIPAMYVINREGNIIWDISRQADESLEAAIQRALREPVEVADDGN